MRSTVRPFAAPCARALGAALLVLSAVVSASAQNPTGTPSDLTGSPTPTPTQTRFDFTPFFAMGDDLAPGGGAAFTFAWTKRLSVEAEASLGTDAGRTSLSLLYHLPTVGRVGIYAAGGAGFQRDKFEGPEPGIGFVTRHKSEFAVNVGAGVSVPLSAKWAWRADFRWYNPDNEWPESWRAYYGLTVNLRH
jgi:opacity protein-like surface antigen